MIEIGTSGEEVELSPDTLCWCDDVWGNIADLLVEEGYTESDSECVKEMTIHVEVEEPVKVIDWREVGE